MGESGGILDEVKDFLKALPQELPLLFRNAPDSRPKALKRVPFRGADVALCAIEAPELKRSEIVRDGEGLTLRRGADRAAPQAVLREWMIDRAREAFAERAAHFARRLGVRYGRISIRDQKTVWGSCTRAGDLSFNWRVIMAPPETLDYLVVHELSHMLEMNHSRRFWAHVEGQCPDWRTHRRWLRDHSGRLKGAIRRAS